MFPDHLIVPWLERLREELPALELIDAHTHIGGNDPDGFSCTATELTASLERAGARAVVFPMHEPGGYGPANDRVMKEASRSNGRLVAFCRLDPHRDPATEAERCLRAGARGIKLHPRAEGFQLLMPKVEAVFRLADQERLPVLVHAGRGIPALGRHALALCERYPNMRLILAHAGISDLAWIWRAAPDHPNLFFDTSWWGAADILALFALVPPGQVLFGSDAPYGTPAFGATMTLRYGLQAGLSPDQLRSVAGEQVERLLRREEPLELGPAPGPGGLPRDPLLDRVYTFLVASIGQMFNGLRAEETLALAALACEVGDDAPQAEVCRSILALLEKRKEAPAEVPGRPSTMAPALPLVVVAAGLARTPDVALPPDPVPVDVGERAA